MPVYHDVDQRNKWFGNNSGFIPRTIIERGGNFFMPTSDLPVTPSGQFVPQPGPGSSYAVRNWKYEPWRFGPFGNAYMPENDPQQQIFNYQRRLMAAHQEVPEPKQSSLKNFLMTALDILDRPRNAIVTAINEFAKPGRQSFAEGLQAALRGLRGEEHTTMSDVFATSGWNPRSGAGRALKAVLGFVGDVAADPLTYVTFGTTGLAKGVASRGAQTVLRSGAMQLRPASELARTLSQQLGLSVDEVTALASRHGKNSTLVMELAERLSGDNAVEARRILEQGLSGINRDTIAGYQQLLTNQLTQAENTLTQISNRRKRSQGQLFGTLRGTDYDPSRLLQEGRVGDFETFAQRLSAVFDPSQLPKNVTVQQKKAVIERILGGRVDDSLAASFTDKDVDLMEALADTFGVKNGASLLETSRNMMERMKKYDASGRFVGYKDPSRFAQFAREEAEAFHGITRIKDGIRFANGLEQVYDHATKSVHLKFLGKPIVEITPVVSAVRQSTNAIVDNVPLLRNTVDALGAIFKPGYVRRAIKVSDPELYNALRDRVVNTVTDYVHRQTGIPYAALQATVSAFRHIPGFLEDANLRKGAVLYIERNLDEDATEAWEKWARENRITPDSPQMKAIKEAAVVNALMNEMYDQMDRLFSLNLFEKKGYDILKQGYGSYVHHAYHQDSEQVERILSGRTTKEAERARLRDRTTFSEARRFTSLARAEKAGLTPVYDIVAASSLRYLESLHLKLNQWMHDEMLKMAASEPALKDLISTTKREGLVEVEKMNLWVAPEIMEQLKRIIDMPLTNEGASYFLKWYDQATNFLKTLQTAYNPSFIIRNAIGEPLMNFFAGVSPEAHALATQILRDTTNVNVTRVGNAVMLNGKPLMRLVMKDGTPWIEYGTGHSQARLWAGGTLPAQDGWLGTGGSHVLDRPFDEAVREELKKHGVKTYQIGNKEYTALEIMDIFRNSGLTWSGISKGNLVENLSDTLRREVKRTSENVAKKALLSPRELGDRMETWVRLAHMLDRLQKGWTVKEAAADVRLYHVDYRDLTPVEKNVFRRLAPYYTYMRKNVPIQLRLLFTKPGIFTGLGHLIANSYATLKDANFQDDPAVPEYLKRGLALPLAMDSEGNIMFLNWNLPLSDVARLQYDLGDLINVNVIDMLSPLIKWPFEESSNVIFSMGTPVEKYEGEQVPIIPGVEGLPTIPRKLDYTIQQLGVVEAARKTLGQALQRALGIEQDPTKPAQVPLVSSVLPIKSQAATKNAMAYQYRDQLQAYVRRLQARGVTMPTYVPIGGPPRYD